MPDRLLTQREREVMELLVQGYSNQEIANRAFMSVSSVKALLGTVAERLPLMERRNRTALATWYLGWKHAALVGAARAAVHSPDDSRDDHMTDLADALKALGHQ